jgi:hypothetical protein
LKPPTGRLRSVRPGPPSRRARVGSKVGVITGMWASTLYSRFQALTPKRASIFTQNALRARRYRGPHEHFAGMPLTPNHKHSLDSAHAKTRGPNPSGTRHTSTARDRGLSTCARPVWPRVPTSEHACGRLSRPLRPLPSIPAWPGWPNSTTGRPPALLSPTPAGI